jgi:hypothetical protein
MKWSVRTCLASALFLCSVAALADGTKKEVPASRDPARMMSDGQGALERNAASTSNRKPDLTPAGAKETRTGGDTCATATVIPSIPYSDSGDTCLMVDNYNEVCPFSVTGGQDVVYQYTPAATITVDIDLCASAFDTKVYVYEDACPDPGSPIACNDDFCGPTTFMSFLSGVTLSAGHTYYIVVDAYSGFDCGTYILDIREGVPPPGCPDGALWSQPPHGPADFWTAFNSDVEGGYAAFDNFSGVIGQITDLHWWGFDVVCCYSECDELNPLFDITFYTDAGGFPGVPVCTYTAVPAVRNPTGILYAGFQLIEFDIPLLSPPCVLGNGWVSIVGTGGNLSCWQYWMSSPVGDGLCYQADASGALTPQSFDLSFCLTGAYTPIFGACCDDNTGDCQDNVELINCIGPGLRFAANTTCEELNPGCGELPGACCYDDGTCAITSQGGCTGQWLGAYTTCDQCPLVCPPGATIESEPCGADTNGGCNSAPPVFEPISCGETVCGFSYYDGGIRDTDWYSITVAQDTLFTWTVQVDFDGLIGLVAMSVPGSGNCADSLGYLDPAAFPAAGTTESVTVCLGPGTHWFFVAPQFADIVDCPGSYIATLTCEPCDFPRGACCLNDGSCVDGITAGECAQMGGTYQGDGSSCDLADCRGACCLPDGSCVDDTSPDGCAQLGGTYQGNGSSCDLVSCPVAPGNDLCENCDPILTNVPVNGTNISATGTDISSCAFNDTTDVWYCWTATCTGIATATTCSGGTFDTTIAVYGAPCLGPELVCNDDFCGLLSSVDWAVTAGTSYRIRVAGYNGQVGDFTLLVTCGGGGGPPNDECVNCTPVQTNVPYNGSTVGATGTDITSCTFNDTKDVWHCWTSPCTGLANFSLCGSSYDTSLAIYDACGGLELGCNDDSCGLQSEVNDIAVNAGDTYYIRVSGYNGQTGAYTLLITVHDCICGDFDHDGDVDLIDYNMFVASYGKCVGDPSFNPECDLDGDGCVTLVDYQLWVECYHVANPGPGTAPPPGPPPTPGSGNPVRRGNAHRAGAEGGVNP